MAIPFVPETGSGLTNSNSYLSVERFMEISDLLGYDYSPYQVEPPEVEEEEDPIPEYEETQIQTFLVRSTMIMDTIFRTRIPGYRATTSQALEWPRTSAYYTPGYVPIEDDVIPWEVELATTEMFYAIVTDVNIQPIVSPSGVLKEEMVKVDVIEERRKYDVQFAGSRERSTKVEDAMSRITGGVESANKLRIIRNGGGREYWS